VSKSIRLSKNVAHFFGQSGPKDENLLQVSKLKYFSQAKPPIDWIKRLILETTLPIWLVLFCCVLNFQDNVFMKEHFNQICRKSRKCGLQKYNIGHVEPSVIIIVSVVWLLCLIISENDYFYYLLFYLPNDYLKLSCFCNIV